MRCFSVKFLWCLCVLESNLDVFYHSCALEIRLLTGRETRTKLQEVVRKGINTLNKRKYISKLEIVCVCLGHEKVYVCGLEEY